MSAEQLKTNIMKHTFSDFQGKMLARKLQKKNFHRNCTKGKKFKMVAENVEKIQKIGKKYNKRAVILSIYH